MKPIRYPGAPDKMPPPNGNGTKQPDQSDNRATGFVPRSGGQVVAPSAGISPETQQTARKAVLWGGALLLLFLFFEGRGGR
jgi:hypothetical protein